MSNIGLVFPWNDIGPAWIATTKKQGVTTKDVVFLLRNVSEHTKQMGGMARLLMKMSKKVAHSKSEGVVDWGLKSIMFATDADDKIQTQLSRELERVRDSVIDNPDVTAFNVPLSFRFGISAEDLVSIINSEVAKK